MLTALIPLVSMLTGAGSPNAAVEKMEWMNREATTVMRRSLVDEAKAQGIQMSEGAVTYATLGSSFLVHGPPVGADLHSEEEFAAGVDVTFLYVGGIREDHELPQGFYRVRATLKVGADEGVVQFIDASGRVASASRLFVRSTDAQDVFVPGSSDPIPDAIPNVTSTHIFRNGKKYVDCAGWTPYRVIYYQVG
jgi:hypothetical protein